MIELKCEACGSITPALNERQEVFHAACPERLNRKSKRLPRFTAFDYGPCRKCGQAFTAKEWDVRHSDENGEDVHDRCCAACVPEDRRHP